MARNTSDTEEQAGDGTPKVDRVATGTTERISADGPLSNADVRAMNRTVAVSGDLRDELQAGDEKLRREALAQGGQEPDSIEHRVYAAPEEQGSGAFGPSGAFQGQATNYIVGQRDIFASSNGQIITSYTLDSGAVTADANGDKVVYEGTVLQASGAKVAPRVSGAAVGVLRSRVNVRYGDAEIGMVVGGRLNSNKLWDNGVFGSVASGAVTQLSALGIYLTPYDA